MMDNQPNKKLIREWLQQRLANPAPLPDIKQIRRQLGWTLTEKTEASLAECNMPVA